MPRASQLILLAAKQFKQIEMPYSALAAYKVQYANARQRGIPFEMTLAEWWGLWSQDDNWSYRGTNGLVMARIGDQGPYKIGNVEIVHCTVNLQSVARATRRAAGRKAWATRIARDPDYRSKMPLYQTGAGHPRSKPVLTPMGRFGSAAEAARAHGITGSAASMNAKYQLRGWRYEAD